MSRNPSTPAHHTRQHTASEPDGAVPPGLRAKLSGRLGSDTLCLPVGQLRDLLAEHEQLRAERDVAIAMASLPRHVVEAIGRALLGDTDTDLQAG